MTAAAHRPDHIRVRPSWDCGVCGTSWPCANAKEDLLGEFDRFPSVLRIFMATQMYDAFDDLAGRGRLPPAHLYERFLAWIVVPPTDRAGSSTPTAPEPRGDATA